MLDLTCLYCPAPIVEGLRGVRAKDRKTCADPECRRKHHNVLNAKWRAENKTYHRAQINAWRSANADRVRATSRAYVDANRAQVYASNQAWREANPDRQRDLVKRWEAENRSARAGYTAQRNRKKRSGLVLTRDWNRLVNRHNGQCAYCASAPVEHMDHVVPLSRGGQHAIGNILPACGSCNSKKSDRLLVEWRSGRNAVARTRRTR